MNTFVILMLLLIVYFFYTNTFENFTATDLQKQYAYKIFTFLSSSDKTYVSYLTFLSDEKILQTNFFNTDMYNKLNNAIKNKTLTLDNLNIIYNNIN